MNAKAWMNWHVVSRTAYKKWKKLTEYFETSDGNHLSADNSEWKLFPQHGFEQSTSNEQQNDFPGWNGKMR